ncbi:MAG: YfcE family phosphodiesterase, partial [Angelakisella sp.]
MRIIAMSDSHGNFNRVRRIVEDNKDTADMFIHLGDGLEEFGDVHHLYPQLHFVAVKGNNDWGSMEQKMKLISCGGKNVMLTHGDLYGVKFGLSDYERAARDAKAEVALYGHTHLACSDYEDGVFLINPGSVMGGSCNPPSYLALDITAAGIVPNIREIQ